VAVVFKGGSTVGPPPESPEALYRDLPRRPDAVPGLWIHQGDILREYVLKHTESPDVALELPTGTGKTIPGLDQKPRAGGWYSKTPSGCEYQPRPPVHAGQLDARPLGTANPELTSRWT